ncbi:MAG: hypothetical protein WD906_00525 [Anaerolineales bacterium]
MKPITFSFHPGMGWTGWARALKLKEMKTEDLLAYERERECVIRVFAQAAIELVLPLAVGRARPTALRAEPNPSSYGAATSGSGEGDPRLSG